MFVKQQKGEREAVRSVTVQYFNKRFREIYSISKAFMFKRNVKKCCVLCILDSFLTFLVEGEFQNNFLNYLKLRYHHITIIIVSPYDRT